MFLNREEEVFEKMATNSLPDLMESAGYDSKSRLLIDSEDPFFCHAL